ncbi:potassium-transporting ATPase subunit KdpA [bacterium]|nr:potassium-transporting ATPase subunit KdpA [bacterium]
MTGLALLQLIVSVAVLLFCAQPLGVAIAKAFSGQPLRYLRFLEPVERAAYRLCGIDPTEEMSWCRYTTCVLAFGFVSFVATYAVQRLQFMLPANPDALPAVSHHSAFNTAVSFVTNTNWQGYSGETTMSPLTQSLALTVQNFVSAAVGLAVMFALARAFTRHEASTIGNFWVDFLRAIVHVLLPLSLVLSVALVSQGVVQSWGPAVEARLLEPVTGENGSLFSTQRIAVGPVASQVAIKQLGTNGGGYFNTNSAHPLENPTPLSNFLEWFAILIIPAACCFAFGETIGDVRQGRAILAAMLTIFLPLVVAATMAEQAGNPVLASLGVDLTHSPGQSGGNMEGKETRFGISASALWAVSTTAASNGSVNSMHDSFTPLGGLVAMSLIQVGEVVFGGVGAGLYGMVIFAIVAVFVSGLMVGRTPEYLGKKIGAFEMKMASLVILFPCATVLIGTAISVSTITGRATILNPGPHGFSEVLYALSSAGNNNGSAFAGLGANTPFYDALLGFAMLIGRYWVMLPVLAIAGSLASKKHVPEGAGTLPTHTPLFVMILIGIVLVVGALSYFPVLALGPIVEHIRMMASSQ